MRAHWTLDDIDWSQLDRSVVTEELLSAVKTAALVEANSADYVTYLHNVFRDDSEFCAAASVWGAEEAQHGAALGRWATLVDPDFDFTAAMARFRDGYRLPLESGESVRGSLAGELLARCVVESGTCSYYAALRDASEEPVLRAVCHRISQDEARHYQLFHRHYQRYPRLSWWRRLRIAIGRVVETGDDELGYAWFSAVESHEPGNDGYLPKVHAARYQAIATGFYQERHVHTLLHMITTALGCRAGSRWSRWLGALGWWWLSRSNQACDSAVASA